MESTDVLPFAAATSTEPGQQTLFKLNDHRTPLPPAAASLLARGSIFAPEWTPEAALRSFRLLMERNHYDEERSYNDLLDSGCPLEHADAAWYAWSRGIAL